MTSKEAVAVLVAAFRQEQLKGTTVDLYVAKLADIPPAILETTIHRLIDTLTFFPSIAEIRRMAAGLAGLLPPGVEEVLALVRAADVEIPVTRRDGSHAYTERVWHWPDQIPDSTLALIRQVLAAVGDPVGADGARIFAWEQGFKAAYERVAEHETQAALSGFAQTPRMLEGSNGDGTQTPEPVG